MQPNNPLSTAPENIYLLHAEGTPILLGTLHTIINLFEAEVPNSGGILPMFQGKVDTKLTGGGNAYLWFCDTEEFQNNGTFNDYPLTLPMREREVVLIEDGQRGVFTHASAAPVTEESVLLFAKFHLAPREFVDVDSLVLDRVSKVRCSVNTVSGLKGVRVPDLITSGAIIF